MNKSLPLFLSLLAASFPAHGKESAGGLDSLLSEGAKPLKLAEGFVFTEGPAASPDGMLFFTDIPNNRIHRWDPKTRKVSVFLKDSGGANALYFTSEGCLLYTYPRPRDS